MFAAERKQIAVDRNAVPEMVDRYIPEEAREDAIKMVRQVNGVTTYLSWMSTGEVQHDRALAFAVAIAGMDAVTDVYNEPVSDGRTAAALRGARTDGAYGAMHNASQTIRSEHFRVFMERLAKAQDDSLEQFENPTRRRLQSLTEAKGGYSAKAHLTAITGDLNAAEVELMQQFGYTMQLLDDYLDQPEDHWEGISTMFTEGHMDRRDLEREVEVTEEMLRDYYGDIKPVKRFGRLMRLHVRLGRLENKYPGTAARLLPWYF